MNQVPTYSFIEAIFDWSSPARKLKSFGLSLLLVLSAVGVWDLYRGFQWAFGAHWNLWHLSPNGVYAVSTLMVGWVIALLGLTIYVWMLRSYYRSRKETVREEIIRERYIEEPEEDEELYDFKHHRQEEWVGDEDPGMYLVSRRMTEDEILQDLINHPPSSYEEAERLEKKYRKLPKVRKYLALNFLSSKNTVFNSPKEPKPNSIQTGSQVTFPLPSQKKKAS